MSTRNAGRSSALVSLSLAAVGAPLVGHAQTLVTGLPGDFQGHYYEVWAQDEVTWADARAHAATRSYADVTGNPADADVPGHLATITSYTEDLFLDGLRGSAFDLIASPLSQPQVWVGGSQPATSATGADWTWENLEGAISTPQVPLASYANWLAGEPNDSGGPGNENHLAIGLTDQFGWNDEGYLANIGGYIIEYDVPVDVAECIGGDGCESISGGGQNLTIPELDAEDATITFRRYEFTDPRVAADTCGAQKLSLFDGALTVPPYLCGSPQFVVVKTEADGFDVLDGTVLVENQVSVVLPNNDYECELPVTGDPQHQDVAVWQSTDASAMLETSMGLPNGAIYDGSAGEFTYDCGSTVMRTRGASYYIIGMHIDFGDDWTTNPDGVENSFVLLTRYKAILLLQAVENSKPVLRTGDYTKLRRQARNVIAHLGRNNFRSALTETRNLLKFIEAATYAPSSFNHYGEHAMRALNIEFMLREKIIPYAP